MDILEPFLHSAVSPLFVIDLVSSRLMMWLSVVKSEWGCVFTFPFAR